MQELGSNPPTILGISQALIGDNIQFGAPQFKNDMEKLELVQGEQRE